MQIVDRVNKVSFTTGLTIKIFAQAYGADTYGGSTYDCVANTSCDVNSDVTAPATGVVSQSPMVILPAVLFIIIAITTSIIITKRLIDRSKAKVVNDENDTINTRVE